MGASAGAGTIHLLASLVSVATCLLVLAHPGSLLQGVGNRLPLLMANGVGSAPSPAGVAAAAAAAESQAEQDLEQCLEAAMEGSWRRVYNTSNRGALPLDVAMWSAADTFEFHGEVFSYEWAWSERASRCGIRRRSTAEVASILANTRLLLLGDSHVRYLNNWIAASLGGKQLPKWNGPDSPPMRLNQTIDKYNITFTYLGRNYAVELNMTLMNWDQPWPDVLLLDSAQWHLFMLKNLTAYTEAMSELLGTIKAVVPHSTLTLWLSPPPRDAKKAHKPDLPPEWIRLYDRIAQDLGFYKPTGPAYHLDLFQLGLDCLPWCTIEDGAHVTDSVNEVLRQQIANMLALRKALPPSTVTRL